MRKAAGVILAIWMLAGCAHHEPVARTQEKPFTPCVTPDLSPFGRVALVNMEARFVVINFPPGTVPQAGETMNINHRGLKVGEVRITGPQRDNDTVGDLVAGQAYVGDEVNGE